MEDCGQRPSCRRRLQATIGPACMIVAVSALSGCGGGGNSPPLEMALRVQLLPQGTLISCESEVPGTARLTRSAAGQNSTQEIACPGRLSLAGDYRLSSWKVESMPKAGTDAVRHGEASATTSLPAPTVLQEGDTVMVLRSEALARLEGEAPQLELLSAGKEQALAYDPAHPTLDVAHASAADAAWRWTVRRDAEVFTSPAVGVRRLGDVAVGGWGALAVADPAQDGHFSFPSAASYADQGLVALTTGRDFRDIRYVDLDNDGREDIVSNVYGTGCVLIGMARAGGGYEVLTPLRRDGSCIGGHGETIVVADFDGDGLPDIFLPAYERFDYLKNVGHGQFVEIADDLGISFPWYLPHVEGAAAVDIDQNGTVDIVVANEVLLNDGTGHFTAVAQPFGPVKLHDEGLAVADIDGDGVFDVAKNDPSLGPRLYWGTSTPTSFADAGWLFGGREVSSRAFGLAVGDVMGDGRNVLVLAGGDLIGSGGSATSTVEDDLAGSSPPPRLCVQLVPRQFSCLNDFLRLQPSSWQDLLLITDVDNDGADDLVARYGSVRVYKSPPPADFVFRIDLRDAQGRRNQFGRAIRAKCAGDGLLVALKFVDGGNGYMAQGNYVVSFHSPWCDRIEVQVPSRGGLVTYGPFAPGLHRVLANF